MVGEIVVLGILTGYGYFTLAGETYTYQGPVHFRKLGTCVTLTAQIYFKHEEKYVIVWRKDSKILKSTSRISVDGKTVYISSLRRSDHAYYQATAVNPVTNITEITDTWLSVKECSKYQKEEVPTSLKSCNELCTDKCAVEWTYVEGSRSKCFRYFNKRETWSTASEKCQAIGGELATIDSRAENEFAGAMLETANGGWIGLNDRDTENKYVWNFNRKDSPDLYTWGTGEPSNYNRGCNIENCVLLEKSTGNWIDYVCNAFRTYICEVPLSYNGTDKDEWSCMSYKCFKFFNDRLTWRDALHRCKQNGGGLATIGSDSENYQAWKLILEDNAWIGLNDIWEAGVYKWNTYQGEFGHRAYYFNWNYGEPNDKFYRPLSGDCPGEDCVQMRKFSGSVTWHDLSCETKVPYICEKIRDRAFSTGAYVGMVIGCIILLAVVFGMIQAAYQKHKRTAVKDIVKAAYQEDIAQREKSRNTSAVLVNNEVIVTPVKYE